MIRDFHKSARLLFHHVTMLLLMVLSFLFFSFFFLVSVGLSTRSLPISLGLSLLLASASSLLYLSLYQVPTLWRADMRDYDTHTQ